MLLSKIIPSASGSMASAQNLNLLQARTRIRLDESQGLDC